MPPSRRIALPLAPLAAWRASLAWRAVRRRGPVRVGVAVELGLLTLGYFLLVLGTGNFWVAVQELPVFDWRYLPGYVLLGLTLAHVVLHWRDEPTRAEANPGRG